MLLRFFLFFLCAHFVVCHARKYRKEKHEILGGDDYDSKPHKKIIILGSDDHDFRPHKKEILGGDDHDSKPHKKIILGSDDHDYKPHKKKILGGDDHDLKPHKKVKLGSDDHDYKPHKKIILGADNHDYKPHEKIILGEADHDFKPHKKILLGGDDHDYKVHRKHGRKHSQKTKMFEQIEDKSKKHSRDIGCCPGDCCLKLSNAIETYLRKDKHKGKKQAHKLGLPNLKHVDSFEQFRNKFGIGYGSEHEYLLRFQIFKDNWRKVKVLRKTEQSTATYGVTKFSDLTEDEFRNMLGFRPSMKPSKSSLQSAIIPNITLPTEYDWRDKGVVTPVKNQGMCGSCWAFSTTGNIEGLWAVKHQQLYSLSEQELVDCDKSDSGCNGGLPENAYKAIKELGGLETESDYPYEATDDSCQFDKNKTKVQVDGSIEFPEDEDAMAKWLYENGPISIGINANTLQFYRSGVAHPFSFLCSPSGIDHGVLIVGFGVHTTKYLHRVQPYWIVKNSWGSDWGEKGYFRVYRGDDTCGVSKMATSATVP